MLPIILLCIWGSCHAIMMFLTVIQYIQILEGLYEYESRLSDGRGGNIVYVP